MKKHWDLSKEDLDIVTESQQEKIMNKSWSFHPVYISDPPQISPSLSQVGATTFSSYLPVQILLQWSYPSFNKN